MSFRTVDLIRKKRDGGELSKAEIEFLIKGYVAGSIPDYQMSALAMAIYFRDMSAQETTDLTLAMAHSGKMIDLSSIVGVKVDKHSTGGVGDTTTLILAPLVAALGVPVAKMSGRGLGHTGGTVDKYEAIPGFSPEMDEQRFLASVNELGVAVIGQSADLTPADKLLYALRDVTATTESVPLIASSVMSKKIAAGADAIVLDVTVGAGAFMKTVPEATRLAKAMVEIGNLAGRKTIAVISDMSEPLGFAIGNALEVVEAIETLQGKGPADLTELVLELGTRMVVLGGVAADADAAREKLQQALVDGSALAKMKEMVANQGGDTSVIDEPARMLIAPYKIALPAKTAGYVREMVADEIGIATMMLGAGRKTKDDTLDPAVGLVLHKKVGDYVAQGEALLTIHANHADVTDVIAKIEQNIQIGERVQPPQLIHAIIE
jgi:pyrimidine-nucleoside phosphorylase